MVFFLTEKNTINTMRPAANIYKKIQSVLDFTVGVQE